MSLSLSEFADSWNKIMPVIGREFFRRSPNELSQGKITLPQLLVLDFLNENSPCRMTDLARFMKVSTPAMTGIIDRLVRHGYTSRVYEPKDRRIIKIRLTVRGTDLIAKIIRQKRDMAIDVFGRISASERQEYLRILLRIRDILAEEKKAKA
jgi:DNA-binding MarR family transcriptional regulator